MTDLAHRTPQQELVDWATSPERVQQYAMVLPEGRRKERFERALKTALIARPELLKADRGSLYLALLRFAELGLVPDGRQGTINVYGDKAVGIVMIAGVRDTLAEFGWMLQTSCVYENDEFAFDEANQLVTHRQARLGEDRGAFIGAYAQARHKDGRRMAEAMTKAEIDRVRDKYSKAAKNGPWVDNYPRMAEKTPGHRLAKKLPLDPKDRERIDRILVEELAPGDAAERLYGPTVYVNGETGEILEASGVADPPEDGRAGGTGHGAPAAPVTSEPAVDADEEPEPSVSDPEEEHQQAALAAADYTPPNGKFAASGTHGPKTIREILDLGDDGARWLKWALAQSNLGGDGHPEYAEAVWAFACVFAPALFQEALAKREVGA